MSDLTKSQDAHPEAVASADQGAESILIQCDVSSVNLCEQLGISLTTWKNSINKDKAKLCSVIRQALISHICSYKPNSPQWGTNTADKLSALLKRDVVVQIRPIKSPPKPPRMPKASVLSFYEDPKSIDRNQYLLKRTARLADQLATVSRDVNGSSIFFFEDTLAKGHNLHRSPRIDWGGRLWSLPQIIKNEIETSIKKASAWASENIKADIEKWKSQDAWYAARYEYDDADETIQTQWTRQDETFARRAELCKLFRDKFKYGTIDADKLKSLLVENENGIEETAERNEPFIAREFQQSSMEYDEIHRAVTWFKDQTRITELECNQRLVSLGWIFTEKGHTGSLYPDANELMTDIKEYKETQERGDAVAKTIKEYEDVLRVLDEAKSGQYPENSEVWSDPTQIHANRCAALKEIFKHKIATGSREPDARTLINDMGTFTKETPIWLVKHRKTTRMHLMKRFGVIVPDNTFDI